MVDGSTTKYNNSTVKVANLASIKVGDLGLPFIWRTLNFAISKFLEKLNMDLLCNSIDLQLIYNFQLTNLKFGDVKI